MARVSRDEGNKGYGGNRGSRVYKGNKVYNGRNASYDHPDHLLITPITFLKRLPPKRTDQQNVRFAIGGPQTAAIAVNDQCSLSSNPENAYGAASATGKSPARVSDHLDHLPQKVAREAYWSMINEK